MSMMVKQQPNGKPKHELAGYQRDLAHLREAAARKRALGLADPLLEIGIAALERRLQAMMGDAA